MAMNPKSMASAIINELKGVDKPEDANNKFYKALCNYVEANAQVFYSWAAMTPPIASTPDPTVVLDCKIKTTGSISPSGQTTPDGACAAFSGMLNSQAALWQVQWPSGFVIPPAFIIPTITITPSGADSQQSAWEAVCTQIIAGLKLATPGPLPGVHAGFTVPCPGAIFTQII